MEVRLFIILIILRLSNTLNSSNLNDNCIFSSKCNNLHDRSSDLWPNLVGLNFLDNRKPVFKDCKDYGPSVKEEQQPSTFVIRVEADDPDEQNTIQYSLTTVSSEKAKFRIDSKTGVIVTAHTFDRDEPIREKEVYVTVRATDNGRPPLDDVCTFKVTITDINDNPPVFDKAKYDESMSEDTEINRAVMRISASDLDDGINSIIEYELLPERDYQYFRIDKQQGLIYLQREIDKQPNQYYTITVHAYNTVLESPQDAQIEVRLRIIESDKKPPIFINPIDKPILLKEDFKNYSQSIIKLSAKSNILDKPWLVFELIHGRTEQTNGKKTFVLNQNGETADITLGKSLDYEAITDYTLTVTVRNSFGLFAEHIIKINIEDVNDNIPYFAEVKTGTILENEPSGTPVMQVRAFDTDGTSANNIVTFELADHNDIFKIDKNTGNITSLTTFDREEREYYDVKVVASDNSPSSLLNDGKPNRGMQVFYIQIADKNDHKPYFKQNEYISHNLPEDANINFLVIEVTALDEDNASQIVYTIENGNIGDAFKIAPLTGKITVNNPLDYELITEYILKIRAFDGIFEDYCTVTIKIENVNDNPPVFKERYNTTIKEETLFDYCILNIEAYDPDIKDPTNEQFIKYSVVKAEQQNIINIDNNGCLRLIQPLDRDLPNGLKNWQVLIVAIDENGNGLKSLTDITITLLDINDNPPFLTNQMPIIWYENRDPGPIIKLTANDYDELQNGPPFYYSIATNSNIDIINKFSIENDILFAKQMFDREEIKEYFIPINVSDSGLPQKFKINILHLIIGDINDNHMEYGNSNIFIYNYLGESPDTDIGRVYVNDPDDWDLNDKYFIWADGIPHTYFHLNPKTGMITMRENITEGIYKLNFLVTEESILIPSHSVESDVIVTVKNIPEEAVDNSGSIRFYNITAEDFIKPKIITRTSINDIDNNNQNIISLKDNLQQILANLLNTSYNNIDIFTVVNYNSSILDVRYSAHGSPYYKSEKLNTIISKNKNLIENELNLNILMINIDECLIEKDKCENSCQNILLKSTVPILIYTNRTSFVGVNSFIQAECNCNNYNIRNIYCLNGGTLINDYCECLDGYNGPNCELINIGFTGNSYAMYPTIKSCDNIKITMELIPQKQYGLIMYIGPLYFNKLLKISDFLSLELINGYPILYVDYGSGTIRIEHNYIKLMNGKIYNIDIILQKTSIEMTVDNCKLSTCMSLGAPQGPNELLNVNTPLQLGGTPINLNNLGKLYNWSYIPQQYGYTGCIRNLTINDYTYNLGKPSLYLNIDNGCQTPYAVAISFGIDRNFLIAILVCIAILLILLLAVVVQKRQQNGWNEKDMDDIRETIINYEDEGGGERDTDYDLNVLRSPSSYYDDNKQYNKNNFKNNYNNDINNEVPDIACFLDDKKDNCDKDSLSYQIDDVRYYAYEGDGNSTGSLSSLASCTDEGDLNFDHLSNFGPRFRKLADMYGEEPSDTDSNVDDDQAWRI